MSFDFATAVAKMGGPLDGLRSTYPNLDFVFDQIEDTAADAEEHGDPAVLAYDKAEAEAAACKAEALVDELADRLAQIRDMLTVVSRMSGVNRECEGMIKQVSGMADDAVQYVARMQA